MTGFSLNYYHNNALTAGVLLSAVPCPLQFVLNNTKGATGNIIQLYDSATVAGINASNMIAQMDTTLNVNQFRYSVQLKNGLVFVCANGTAGDCTVVFG